MIVYSLKITYECIDTLSTVIVDEDEYVHKLSHINNYIYTYGMYLLLENIEYSRCILL